MGSTQDPEADWIVKASSDRKQKITYGFKARINVDDDGFIKATGYNKGSFHDSNICKGLKIVIKPF